MLDGSAVVGCESSDGLRVHTGLAGCGVCCWSLMADWRVLVGAARLVVPPFVVSTHGLCLP